MCLYLVQPKTEVKVYVGLTALQAEWYKKLVSRDMQLLLKQSGAAHTDSEAGAAQGSDWRRLMSLMMQLRKGQHTHTGSFFKEV